MTLTIPLPDPLLTPNQRMHWGARARHVKAQREAAYWKALDTARFMGIGGGTNPFPLRGRVRVDIEVFPRPRMKRCDDDNFWAAMKATLDGLQDAGIVANDRQFVLGELIWWTNRTSELILTLTQVTP